MNSATATLAHKSTNFYNLLLISHTDGWKVTSLHAKDTDGDLLDIRASRQVSKTLTEVLETASDPSQVLADVRKIHSGVTISQVQFTSVEENRVISLHINGTYQARDLKVAA